MVLATFGLGFAMFALGGIFAIICIVAIASFAAAFLN